MKDFRDEQEELRQAFEFYDQVGKGQIRLGDL
jgi:Ca2+-binding EF-hand superfamily protein